MDGRQLRRANLTPEKSPRFVRNIYANHIVLLKRNLTNAKTTSRISPISHHQSSSINHQAQTLAVASFNSIRARLEYQAIGLLRSGKTQVEVERAVLYLEPLSAILADGLDLIRAFPSSSPRGVTSRARRGSQRS